jgi:hypothetical protein
MSSNVLNIDPVRDVVPTRARVRAIEAEVARQPQVHCPVRNMFAHGMYIREMKIPAGTLATGAVHKTDHLTMIVKGRVKIISEQGEREYTAPATLMSRAGSQKAALAIEETVMLTMHNTFETDVYKLITELTDARPEELIGGTENKQLKAHGRHA